MHKPTDPPGVAARAASEPDVEAPTDVAGVTLDGLLCLTELREHERRCAEADLQRIARKLRPQLQRIARKQRVALRRVVVPRVRLPRARARARRPGCARRTAASSRTSSVDPGDPEPARQLEGRRRR